mgnify:CR=1 FL=1
MVSSMLREACAVTAAVALMGAIVVTPAAAEYSATGTVVRVTDGDTFLGKIAAEAAPVSRVRLAGIQAMERGECHADEAEAALRRLLPRKTKVTVKARFKNAHVPNQKGSEPRPLRLAFNHRGQDVQTELLRQGLVLPNSVRNETMNEKDYSRAGQEAAAAGVGLFDTDACRSGPYQEAVLNLYVNYNADGNDRTNKQGKYARLVNAGVTPVDIGGWKLRTSKHQFFNFPSGTVIQPQASIQIHQGAGSNGNGHFYFGTKVDFANPEASRYGIGGAYLQDPDGDLRAWTFYPCQVNCTSPLTGKVSVRANYDPEGNEAEDPNRETVDITNTSGEIVDLSFHVLTVMAEVYEFPQGTTLAPGETAYVHVGRGGTERLHHYLDRNETILPNSGKGSVALLRTHTSVRIACHAWGSSSC